MRAARGGHGWCVSVLGHFPTQARGLSGAGSRALSVALTSEQDVNPRFDFRLSRYASAGSTALAAACCLVAWLEVGQLPGARRKRDVSGS